MVVVAVVVLPTESWVSSFPPDEVVVEAALASSSAVGAVERCDSSPAVRCVSSSAVKTASRCVSSPAVESAPSSGFGVAPRSESFESSSELLLGGGGGGGLDFFFFGA